MSIQYLIHTPTNQLENSIQFYKTVGFKQQEKDGLQLMSDSQCIIEINPDRFARAGVKLFRKSWKKEIEELQKHTPNTTIPGGYLIADPSGVYIYLMESEQSFDLSADHKSILGNFAGLSLETNELERSVKIWSTLGFEKSMGSIEQGWVAYQSDLGLGLSFMRPLTCPHLFFNPSLTYFNSGKNLEVIAAIRQKNIPITEEITQFNKEGIVDNIIIRDPGGYGFFIFND